MDTKNHDLSAAPLISPGAIARVLGISKETVVAISERLGDDAARTPSGRVLFTVAQAERVAQELRRK